MPRNPECAGRGRRLWPLYSLKSLRLSRGLSYRDLARESGVSKRHVLRLDHLESFATVTTRQKLADALDTDPEYLSGYDPPTYHWIDA